MIAMYYHSGSQGRQKFGENFLSMAELWSMHQVLAKDSMHLLLGTHGGGLHPKLQKQHGLINYFKLCVENKTALSAGKPKGSMISTAYEYCKKSLVEKPFLFQSSEAWKHEVLASSLKLVDSEVDVSTRPYSYWEGREQTSVLGDGTNYSTAAQSIVEHFRFPRISFADATVLEPAGDVNEKIFEPIYREDSRKEFRGVAVSKLMFEIASHDLLAMTGHAGLASFGDYTGLDESGTILSNYAVFIVLFERSARSITPQVRIPFYDMHLHTPDENKVMPYAEWSENFTVLEPYFKRYNHRSSSNFEVHDFPRYLSVVSPRLVPYAPRDVSPNAIRRSRATRGTEKSSETLIEVGIEDLVSQNQGGPDGTPAQFRDGRDHPFLHPSLYAPRAVHEENGTINIALQGSFAYPSLLLRKSQSFDSESGIYESLINGGIVPLIALPGPPKHAFHNELLSEKV
jgi:hypothetical protein